MISKAKKILFWTVLGLTVWIIVVNILEKSTLRYFPFVDPIQDVPVLLVVAASFAAGWLGNNLFRWWREIKKKVKGTP